MREKFLKQTRASKAKQSDGGGGGGEDKLASILYGKQVRPGKFDGSPDGKQRVRMKEMKRVEEREGGRGKDGALRPQQSWLELSQTKRSIQPADGSYFIFS